MKAILKQNFTIVACSALIVSIYFIVGVMLSANSQYVSINAKKLEEAAILLKKFTPNTIFSDTEATVDWISQIEAAPYEIPYRITLISRNGLVLYDTDADTAAMENHLDRLEFQTAIRTGIGSSRRRSATLGHEYFYTAIAINNLEDQFAGVIRLSYMVPGFYSRLFESAIPFLAFGLLLILGSTLGLYYFSRSISRSIEIKLNTELEEKTHRLMEKTKQIESEGRYRETILNSMFEGIITIDSSLTVILANPMSRSLFNFNSKIDLGENNHRSLIEFTHSAELVEAAKTVLATGQLLEQTIKRYSSGIVQHFQVLCSPLEQGAIISLRDISRLVKLEQIRQDFTANVSHELRTPIQVIQGFAETILDSTLEDKEQIRYFTGIIKKNAQGMENITNDLLALVGLEEASTTVAEYAEQPKMEKEAMLPLIMEAVDALTIASKNKNIAITVSCPEDLHAPLHAALFVQALVNLLDNGIKYSSSGSSIQVAAFFQDNDTIDAAGIENNATGCVVVEVKDQGIGIPAEHLDRIFERFYRVDRSRSRQEGGTGLGLSIVRHIALLHGGSVEAESHSGEGSIFRIKIPAPGSK